MTNRDIHLKSLRQCVPAIVLAAGLGRRMGSLSDTTPKPLTVVGGQSLLSRIIDQFKDLAAPQICVNVHHHSDQIQAHLSADHAAGLIAFSDEREGLLETGGGVKKALKLIKGHSKYVFVCNSDICWIDKHQNMNALGLMQAAFNSDRMDALLLMVPTPKALGYDGVGDFFMGTAKAEVPRPLTFRGNAKTAPFMYGGIMLVDPSLYDGTPEGAWSNRLIFHKAYEVGRLMGMTLPIHWMHVGTPSGIQLAEDAFNRLHDKASIS